MARGRTSTKPTLSTPDSIRGHVDRVSTDGLVFGWCVNETSPEDRSEVTIFADGVEIGRAVAASFRQDLMDAGVGTGRHGFAYTLPISVMRQKRSTRIMVRHSASGFALGDPITYRSEPIVNFDDRLTQIESDLLLVRDRLEVTTSSDASIGMLFDAVGTFFARLGQDLREGRASSEGMGLAGRVDSLVASYKPVKLPFVAAPRVAVFVGATSDLHTLHGLLRSIAATEFVLQADVFLLDAGSDVNAALLPTVVRNLRYHRLDDGQAITGENLIRQVQHELLLFVDGAAQITGVELENLLAQLLENVEAGLVGIPLKPGELGMHEAFGPGVVHWGAFAMRAEALTAVGGFDPGYYDLAIAVVDLCLRLARSPWLIAHATVSFESLVPFLHAEHRRNRRRDMVVLQERWPELFADNSGAA